MAALSAPDYAEPFVAWRTWSLTGSGRWTRLRSVVKATIWEPLRPLRAECLRPRLVRRFRRHAPPGFECVCGIYGSELPVAASYLDGSRLGVGSRSVRQVLGRVALWGEVVVCEHGYRASYAYPEHLYVAALDRRGAERTDTYEVAAALERYGVPVTVADVDEVQLLRLLTARRAA